MTKIHTSILSLIFLSQLHGLRFILGLSEFIWAVTLTLPGNTFNRPTYTVMASFMSECAWAVLFAIMGLCQWFIIYKQDYHSKFAIIFAGCNSIFWWFVVMSMVVSVAPFPAAISGEVGLAVGAAWIFIRSGMPCIYQKKFDRSAQHDT